MRILKIASNTLSNPLKGFPDKFPRIFMYLFNNYSLENLICFNICHEHNFLSVSIKDICKKYTIGNVLGDPEKEDYALGHLILR